PRSGELPPERRRCGAGWETVIHFLTSSKTQRPFGSRNISARVGYRRRHVALGYHRALSRTNHAGNSAAWAALERRNDCVDPHHEEECYFGGGLVSFGLFSADHRAAFLFAFWLAACQPPAAAQAETKAAF